jgi:hypothetical protein
MAIQLYQRNTNELRAILEPDESSEQQGAIMGADQVVINVATWKAIPFKIGDYANIFGGVYKLNALPSVTKVWKFKYQYSLTLEGLMYDLTKVQYLFLNANNQFTEAKFSFRGRPLELCQLIIYNLRRVFPEAPWRLGFVIEAEPQTIDFTAQNCLEALSTIASTFNTEYLFEGHTINLYKKQLNSGVVLEYGQNNTLYGLTRQNADNSNVITRLYAFGSNRNIGSNYRLGAQFLRMAESLYIEKTDDPRWIVEDTVYFDGTDGRPEIYPHRTGVVSGVTSPFIFTDDSMDFDVNAYLLPDGTSAKITFNTGLLSGLVFELHSYNAATRTFTINPNTEISTFTAPSEDYKPAVGDAYVITDILQPISYINEAEAQLKAEAIKYLNENSSPQLTYSVVCNPIFFKQNNITVSLGQTVGIIDADLDINRQIRITGFTRNLRTPSLFTMTLSDTVKVQSTIVKLINGL